MSSKFSSEEDFMNHLSTQVHGSFTTLALGLGHRLGLFKILASLNEPASSHQIAAKGKFKERYIREWLGIMVTSGIIEVDATGTQFFLPRQHIQALTEPGTPAVWAYAALILNRASTEIEKCFAEEGPQGVSSSVYDGIHDFFEHRDAESSNHNTMRNVIAKVPGLKSLLESGINMLEIGCSKGNYIRALAKEYPNSHFTGLDMEANVIQTANECSVSEGITNTSFLVHDVCNLPSDWSATYDYILLVDTFHDLPHPRPVLAEIVRILKPSGICSVVDINLHSNIADNKDTGAVVAYTFSLMYCMPTALVHEGGEGNGTAWGREKMIDAIKEAGFQNVSAERIGDGPLTDSDGLVHFICYK